MGRHLVLQLGQAGYDERQLPEKKKYYDTNT